MRERGEMRSGKPIGKIRTFTRYDKFMDVIKGKAFIGRFTIKVTSGGELPVYERKNV